METVQAQFVTMLVDRMTKLEQDADELRKECGHNRATIGCLRHELETRTLNNTPSGPGDRFQPKTFPKGVYFNVHLYVDVPGLRTTKELAVALVAREICTVTMSGIDYNIPDATLSRPILNVEGVVHDETGFAVLRKQVMRMIQEVWGHILVPERVGVRGTMGSWKTSGVVQEVMYPHIWCLLIAEDWGAVEAVKTGTWPEKTYHPTTWNEYADSEEMYLEATTQLLTAYATDRVVLANPFSVTKLRRLLHLVISNSDYDDID